MWCMSIQFDPSSPFFFTCSYKTNHNKLFQYWVRNYSDFRGMISAWENYQAWKRFLVFKKKAIQIHDKCYPKPSCIIYIWVNSNECKAAILKCLLGARSVRQVLNQFLVLLRIHFLNPVSKSPVNRMAYCHDNNLTYGLFDDPSRWMGGISHCRLNGWENKAAEWGVERRVKHPAGARGCPVLMDCLLFTLATKSKLPGCDPPGQHPDNVRTPYQWKLYIY